MGANSSCHLKILIKEVDPTIYPQTSDQEVLGQEVEGKPYDKYEVLPIVPVEHGATINVKNRR